ncbi:MAG: SIS domain-containing protein, partial [Desulfobacter postgatei]|uniref:SIS domain-containing protein n=1 Tax=Desulfobacter postgatei TaxID=2293 RepID=UPI0023F26348
MKWQDNLSAQLFNYLKDIAKINVDMGKPLSSVKENTLLFFPDTGCTLGCGICALVAFKGPACENDLDSLSKGIETLSQNRLGPLSKGKPPMVSENYLGGADFLSTLFDHAQNLKQETSFASLFYNREKTRKLSGIAQDIEKILTNEVRDFKSATAGLSTPEAEIASNYIDLLKDIVWCLKKEIIDNIEAIANLAPGIEKQNNPSGIALFKRINAVLNSLDRLEVRGRDSAGISVLCTLDEKEFSKYKRVLEKSGLDKDLENRSNRQILSNNTISVNEVSGPGSQNRITICFVYKFAAEIGALGDNIAFIRNQIKKDPILQALAEFSPLTSSVSAHTRWASIGDITEANCHPLDNASTDTRIPRSGIIHVCLNGDIDNYLELKTEYEARYDKIHPQITTDTKLIPLQIEHHLKTGAPIEEAFRLAVNEFEGSHAISMHTDLAPGKLFLAQKGSGQAIFVGLAPDHYIAASELYGVVEETRHYIKLKGEEKGQIVVLDQEGAGGIEGVRSFYYDKQPITLTRDDVLESQITSRDIDRQGYNHYFLKEISESPLSVEKTLENKFKQNPVSGLLNINLHRTIIPPDLEEELRSGKIKKIFFIGQGTAGIAAQGCADLLTHYLGSKSIDIRAQKASELSGFSMGGKGENTRAMENTLVVAISQSGTTTDTNRTVDMVRAHGGRSLAIVNRRDSDLTFKVDGVLYTSSGRDIEMSVASTKAFYSQITAGAVLGLHIAALLNARSEKYIHEQIRALMELPA